MKSVQNNKKTGSRLVPGVPVPRARSKRSKRTLETQSDGGRQPFAQQAPNIGEDSFD